MAIASLVVMGVSAVANYSQTQQNAANQKMAQDYHNISVRQNALQQYDALNRQEENVRESAAEQQLQNQYNLMEQQARVKLLASASGTAGSSITSMLSDLSQTGGMNQATIVQNARKQHEDINLQAEQIQQAATRGQDNTPIEQASLFKSALHGMQQGQGFGSAWSGMKSAFSDASTPTLQRPMAQPQGGLIPIETIATTYKR